MRNDLDSYLGLEDRYHEISGTFPTTFVSVCHLYCVLYSSTTWHKIGFF